jgi:hypothetical protein
MDEQQIKALVSQTVNESIDSLLPRMVEGVLEEFNAKLPKNQPEADDSNDKVLMNRVAQLEQKLEAADKAQKEQQEAHLQEKYNTYIQGQLLNRNDVLHPSAVQQLLAQEVGKATLKNGEWFTQDGSKVSEKVETFFSTDVGKHFLKPAGSPGGSGTLDSNGDKTPTSDNSLEGMLNNLVF